MSVYRKAVFAASLDPITNGHLWVIQEATRLFDEVVVAVGVNPLKSSKYFFSASERVEMAEKSRGSLIYSVKEMGMVYLVDFAKENQITHIIRGIRNFHDFEFEQTLNYVNSGMAPDITTVFVMPPPEVSQISSSFVKSLIGYDGWQTQIRKYVHPFVAERLIAKGQK